jgi:hypothetical protein
MRLADLQEIDGQKDKIRVKMDKDMTTQFH